MSNLIEDKKFKVVCVDRTKRPNLLSYLAMHQDYSEGATIDDFEKLYSLSEKELGDRLVRNCINYNHWGVLEHPSITFNVIGFPHSVLVQARTHRIGVSFDAQSQRYTGKRILDLVDNKLVPGVFSEQEETDAIEEIFYFRPLGDYLDREGNKYPYDQEDKEKDIFLTRALCFWYADKVEHFGYAPEHARDLLPQNIRQNFVVTFNARSLLHFCDLRLPMDAQPEIRVLAQKLFLHFEDWMPEIAENYKKKRYGKNKLAP